MYPPPPYCWLASSRRALIEISASTSSLLRSLITRSYGSGSGPGMTRASISTLMFSSASFMGAMLTRRHGDYQQRRAGSRCEHEVAFAFKERECPLELLRRGVV